MDAKELRIGNITNKGVVTAFPMGCSHSEEEIDCNYYSYKLEDVKPVPLTEEWLLKFGFDAEHGGVWFNIRYGTEQDMVDEVINISINVNNGRLAIFDSETLDEHAYTKKPIKYVHQLQNLYFALTGEELTIK